MIMKTYVILLLAMSSTFTLFSQEGETTDSQAVEETVIAETESTDEASQEVKLISIAGQIVDLDSSEAMGGVKVVNETRNQTIASTKSGYYSIVAGPGDIIRFSHVGYEPEYMRVNEFEGTKTFVKIHLKEDAYFIEEVIVGELPSESELNEYFMSLDVDEDLSRAIVEANPETFRILDNIVEPPPGGPISFLKDKVFDKLKEKKKKPGRAKDLPKSKNE